MTAEHNVINKQLATKANVTMTHASHISSVNLIILAYPSKCHAIRRLFYMRARRAGCAQNLCT
jgi:hypothetical protein